MIKLKIIPQFPSNVLPENFLTVTKQNGVWTIGVDYTLIGPGTITTAANAQLVVLDEDLGTYKLVSLASLFTSALDLDLQAIAALTGAGILARTADSTWALRTITGTANEVTIINGPGTAGNPTVSLPSALTFTGKTITGGSYNGATITTSTYNGNTWTAGSGTLTLGAGKTFTASNTMTQTATDGSSIAFGAGGTVAYTANKLSAFAATSSLELAGVISDETGSGSLVFATSPTFVTPVLGTPTSVTLTNATGLPVSTGISGLAAGVATFLATPSSANLKAAITDETGSGAAVFATSPTLVSPILGTPTSGTLTNVTGLPISTGVSGLGTGIATALAVNTGSAGAPVLFNGALGTPSSGTLTSSTGLPISTGVSGLGTGIATSLAVNVGTAGAPVINGGALGTPSSGTLTNATGLPLSGLIGQGAYTIIANNTGGSAVPTAVSIPALTSKASPVSADIVLIQDSAASNAFKQTTVGALASAGSVASIAGNTGAFTLGSGLTNSVNVLKNSGVVTVKKQIFAASGTYTPSTGMIYCLVEVVGAGGGGGGARGAAAGTSDAGGGGGSGAYGRTLATAATIGASQTVTIGGGGAGGVSNASGSAGGATSVGIVCTAGGGGGGVFGSVSFAGPGSGGNGGAAGTADLAVIGTPGQEGIYFGGGVLLRAGGFGGPSYFGGAGIGGGSGGAASNGTAGTIGGGGGGAYGSNGAGAANGGNGGPGYVFITEYCNQ